MYMYIYMIHVAGVESTCTHDYYASFPECTILFFTFLSLYPTYMYVQRTFHIILVSLVFPVQRVLYWSSAPHSVCVGASRCPVD